MVYEFYGACSAFMFMFMCFFGGVVKSNIVW